MSAIGAAIKVTDPMTVEVRQAWRTPRPLFDAFHARRRYDVDAAADDENHLLALYWTIRENGIRQLGLQENAKLSAFVNPNYDDIEPWTAVCLWRARNLGAVSELLLPSRTDQRWFHEHALSGEAWFSRGRVQFVAPPGVKRSSNSGGSVLVIFDPETLGRGIVRAFDAKTGALL